MMEPKKDEITVKNLNCPELFGKISDITRIVDPLQKRVITDKNGTILMKEVHCFDFWENNRVCDNCISMRAYNDNSTYVKMEYRKDKIFMITAVPFALDDRRVVVEILKDITTSMLFDFNKEALKEHTEIHALIDNMNKLSFHDPLTELYNRRYIMEKLPVDLLNAALSSTHLSIIMADIDYFKKVNDSYGHVAGDYVLKNVAKIFSGCIVRGSDWVARYGGEEFLICMPGADLEAAKNVAERMRAALNNFVTHYENKEIYATASFGVCSTVSAGTESVEAFLKRADEKLYQAKGNGRNRVEY